MQTLRRLVRGLGEVAFEFLGHPQAMPLVLDQESIRLYPPMQVQVIAIDEKSEYVDFVYIGRIIQRNLPIREGEGHPIGWFDMNNLQNSPNHVKQVVCDVLRLGNP